MNEQSYYRISVKGIVVDHDGRFLMSKEENGIWELLGGGLEHEEDPVTGLKREILEETGLKVVSVSKTPIYFVTSKRLEHDTYIANIIYEIKLENLKFTPSEECVELKFFNVEEAKRVNIFPNVEKFLEVFDPTNHPA